MMLKALVISSALLFSTAALAGDRVGFDLPKGWVLDEKSRSHQGVDAALHPKGQQWATSPAVMYIRVTPKLGSVQKTIDEDLQGFKDTIPGLIITDLPSLFTRDGKIAFVKRLEDPKNTSTEIMAYADGGDTVSIVALDTKTKKAADKALPAFKKLVASYDFTPAKKADVKEAKKADETKTETEKK